MSTSGGYIRSLAKPQSALRFFFRKTLQTLSPSLDSHRCLGCRWFARTGPSAVNARSRISTAVRLSLVNTGGKSDSYKSKSERYWLLSGLEVRSSDHASCFSGKLDSSAETACAVPARTVDRTRRRRGNEVDGPMQRTGWRKAEIENCAA